MKTTLIPILALAFTAMPFARADEFHDLLDKLQSEVTKTIEEHQKDKKSHYEMDRLSGDMAKLASDFARDTFNAADAGRVLTQFAKSKASPEAKQIAAQLNALLPEQAAAHEKDFAQRLDAALKKAGEACLAAKKDSDLDAASTELNGLKVRGYDTSPERSRNVVRLEAAQRFVLRWQEYLTQLASGYDERAKNILHDLAETPGTYPLLTREQILSKIGGEAKSEPPEAIMSAVKNLDELPGAIAQIGAANKVRRSTDPGAYETTATLNDLKQIYKAHAAAKAGLYHDALQAATSIYGSNTGVVPAETIRLKTMLLAEVLPRYLELPDDAIPRAGENPGQFLLRIADEAASKNDWEKVQRVLDAYRISAFGPRAPSWLQGEIAACSSYLFAQKLENAGDFRRAAIEYEKVLLQSGKRIPVKETTARLTAIKKEHPEAFEAASKASETSDDSATPTKPR